MALREMRSYALTPSIDKIVASGSRSVTACAACATHSHPALVDNAHWNRAVALSATFANCCEIVLATKRRTTSTAYNASDPTSRLLQGCHAPLPQDGCDVLWHMASRQQFCHAEEQMHRGLSSNGLKCSLVIPNGPPAVPLREDRKFAANLSLSKENRLAGSTCAISGGRGSWSSQVVGALCQCCLWNKISTFQRDLSSRQLSHLILVIARFDPMFQIVLVLRTTLSAGQ